MLKRGIQVLTLVVFLLAGILVALGATVSWWLPPLAGQILPRWGVTLQDSRRGPGGAWILERVHYGQPEGGVALRVDRISFPNPLHWAWAGWREKGSALDPLQVEGLDLHLRSSPARESATPPPEGKAPGPGEVLPGVAGALRVVERWLPPVEGKKWRIFPADQASPLVLPEVDWKDAALTARLASWAGWPAARLRAQLPHAGSWNLRATVPAWEGELQLEIDPNPHVPSARGRLRLGEGKGTFAASWGAAEWIPARAEATLDQLRLPKPLPVGDLPAPVRALSLVHAEGRWDGQGYRAELQLGGTPGGERVRAELSVEGAGAEVTIRQLQARTGWAEVKLDDAVRLDLGLLEAENPFRLTGSADLSQQDYLDATGSLRFRLSAHPRGDPLLPVEFSAEGTDLAYESTVLGDLSLEGSWDFPQVEVRQLELEAPGESRVRLQGSADVVGQSLAVKMDGDLQPADLRTWSGSAPGLTEAVKVSLEAKGPWDSPRHQGTLQTDGLTYPPLVPLGLSLQWQGKGIEELAGSAAVQASGEALTLAVDSVSLPQGKPWEVRVASAAWTRAGEDFLRLQAPFRVHIDPAAREDWPWKGFVVETFALAGEGRSLAAYWNPPEEALVQVGGLRADRFSGWFAEPEALPTLEVGQFSLRVNDFLPLLEAETSADLSWTPPGESQPVRAVWQAVLDPSGVRIGSLEVDYGDLALVRGEGQLPVLLATGSLDHPYGGEGSPEDGKDPDAAHLQAAVSGPLPFLRLLPKEKVDLSFRNQWGPDAEEWLRQATGVDLGDLLLDLQVQGTLESPEATLSLHAEQLQWPDQWANGQLPRLRRIDLSLTANRDRISLKKGEVELRDSLLQAEASLPYESVYPWLEGKNPAPGEWLEALTGEVRLENWTAKAWENRLPKVFRSSGTLTGTIQVKKGLQLGGQLQARDFGLRPTAATSAIDAINADLRLDGRRIILEKMTGSTGGGGLELTGSLDATHPDDPSYQLTLRGKDVPVARTPSLVIRSDLDLQLKNPGGGKPTRLSGELDFQNSTYLLEIDPFAPNVRSGPSARPPYFAVEAKPFADWELEVRLTGQDFLRVRSSVLSTSLSANLRLEGTLGEPRLLGSVRTESGTLRFPGMNLRIESAEAFVVPQSPRTLFLEVSGIGRSQSTIVTMNVTGSAESPQVAFASTPSRSNADILRILTTGSTGGGGGAQALGLYLGRIFAGVDGGSDRLTVELGEDVSENGRSTLEVIYRLNRRWSLQGEYDIYDNYNFNLRRLLYEK